MVNCFESENSDIQTTRRIYQRVSGISLVSMFYSKEIKITGFTSILINLNRKRFSLCRKHYVEFELGVFSPLDCCKLNIF